MKRTLTVFLVCGFLAAGTVAECLAQTTSETTTSATRRASLFGGSRVQLFNAGGNRGEDRDMLKAESLQTEDRMMSMLERYDPSEMLDNADVSNMGLFLTNALRDALNLATEADVAFEDGGLIMATSGNEEVNTGDGLSDIRGPGIYAPRLQFLPDPEELAAMQTPEGMAQLAEKDAARSVRLINELIDKFDLPETANMSLEFHDLTVHLQGRVPNPILRKQIEMYLMFEPGIYSVRNDLTIDSKLPTMRNDPAVR